MIKKEGLAINSLLTQVDCIMQRIPAGEGEIITVRLQQQARENKRGFRCRNCHNKSVPQFEIQKWNEGNSVPLLQPWRSNIWSWFPPIIVLPSLMRATLSRGNSICVLYICSQHRPRIPDIWTSLGGALQWYTCRRTEQPSHCSLCQNGNAETAQAEPWSGWFDL